MDTIGENGKSYNPVWELQNPFWNWNRIDSECSTVWSSDKPQYICNTSPISDDGCLSDQHAGYLAQKP